MLLTGLKSLAYIIFAPIALLGFWVKEGLPRKPNSSVDAEVLIASIGIHMICLILWTLAVMVIYSTVN